MRTRWPILALLCVLASLLVPGIASAHPASGAENRVWAFDLAGQVHVGGQQALTLELHQGSALAEYDVASGSLLAAKGAGGVGDALKGLRAGRSSGVKVVDSAEEMNGLFSRLNSGGKTIGGSTYPGRLVKLPDGTGVGLRTGSKSGGPTINIKLPDGTRQKIHVRK